MENEILKQWQRDYPSIPADVLAKLAGFLETVCGGDAARRCHQTGGGGII